MEYILKIIIFEYFRNRNLSLDDRPNFTNASIEDDLKILKVEYLSNHWLDLTQF